ncbi:hypothetical protein WR25_25024 [Diploscapter pachys]|uniref:ribonuclease H n=1 Tax=Diploscapter pachys TaxID=2018661 RepID=A0A2A2KCV0_9BILA|nr:hypothetical protein WR25_25024 [Diploscapter pachys]
MELTAAIEALRVLTRPCRIRLSTDSKYVMDGLTRWIHGWRKNGWRTADKKPVKNAELWQALFAETQKHEIEWDRSDRVTRRGTALIALGPPDQFVVELELGDELARLVLLDHEPVRHDDTPADTMCNVIAKKRTR